MNATADAFMAIFGMKRVKPKTCKACRCKFTPVRPLQTVCGPQCAAEVAARQRKAQAVAKAKEERKAFRERKEKVKRRGDLMQEAQAAFNAYVRARDAGQPCICCGQPMEPEKPGGAIDAGHFRSVGSAPHLRFTETNVHAQRKNCNRPGGTTYAAYRAGLVARIGLAAVEELESDQTPRKWTAEDLRGIRDAYKRKTRELLNASR